MTSFAVWLGFSGSLQERGLERKKIRRPPAAMQCSCLSLLFQETMIACAFPALKTPSGQEPRTSQESKSPLKDFKRGVGSGSWQVFPTDD